MRAVSSERMLPQLAGWEGRFAFAGGFVAHFRVFCAGLGRA
jgi:hypothetical protein